MKKTNLLPYLNVALRLLIICVAAAVLLAAVNAVTEDRIAAVQKEKTAQSIKTLFAASDRTEALEGGYADEISAVYRVYTGDALCGYCVMTVTTGYESDLQLMIGYDTAGKISGIVPVTHKETKGIGTNALTETYLAQYVGLSGTLALGDAVDGYTGATLSSKGILAGVNAANAAISEVIGK